MTYQEFNNIYYTFTKNKKGIQPNDSIRTNGYELKEFIEHALSKISEQKKQIPLNF